MDWDKIRLPSPKSNKIQLSGLTDFDYWLTYISAKLMNKSMSEVARTALILYLRQKWRGDSRDHEDRLALYANQLRLSKEELIMQMANDADIIKTVQTITVNNSDAISEK